MAHRTIVAKPLVPSFSRVTDARERDFFWTRLTSLWNCPKRLGFPCCNPRSLSSRSAQALRQHRYDICLKSDGVRYVLLMTTREGNDDAPVSLMIDRARNMFEVELVAPEEYFTRGTVLEGELVWQQPDERAMLYCVFDALVIRGERLASKPFSARHAELSRAVRLSCDIQDVDDVEDRALEHDSIVMVHYRPRIEMRLKRFVSLEHATRLWSERGDADHRVDGIILQDVDAPYRCGTASDDSCLKWKEHSTVDLVGPPHDLRAVDGPIGERIEGRRVVVLPSRIVGGDAQIVEYLIAVTADEVQLMAIRTRPDKDHANSRRVVEATVDDVVHELTPEDLAASVST